MKTTYEFTVKGIYGTDDLAAFRGEAIKGWQFTEFLIDKYHKGFL